MSVRTQSRLLAALALHSRLRPNSIALAEIDDAGDIDAACTYATLQAQVSRVSALMADTAQVGDAIIGIMPAGIAAATCCLAALAAGVRWVGLDARSAPREILAIAARAHATLAIVHDAPAARFALFYKSIRRTITAPVSCLTNRFPLPIPPAQNPYGPQANKITFAHSPPDPHR